jgi:hypothetical protein
MAWSLRGTAYVSTVCGDPAAARPLIEHSLQICRAIDDQRGLAWSIFDLGEVAFAAGDLAAAKRWLIEAEQIFESRDVPYGVYRVAYTSATWPAPAGSCTPRTGPTRTTGAPA